MLKIFKSLRITANKQRLVDQSELIIVNLERLIYNSKIFKCVWAFLVSILFFSIESMSPQAYHVKQIVISRN